MSPLSSLCRIFTSFTEWYPALLALGRRERLVTPLVNFGGHPVYQVTLNRVRWTNLIALAVEREELTWPSSIMAQKRNVNAAFVG